jgi:type IV secretory pathway TrbF-like protein
VPYRTSAKASRPADRQKPKNNASKAALKKTPGNRIFASGLLFYPQNEADFDKNIGRKTMIKGRKWRFFGLTGLLLGVMAALTSFFIKQRKPRQRIY